MVAAVEANGITTLDVSTDPSGRGFEVTVAVLMQSRPSIEDLSGEAEVVG